MVAGYFRRFGYALAIAASAIAGAARGEDYPSRSVTFLVPYAPGGGTDIYSRMLAEELRTQLRRLWSRTRRAPRPRLPRPRYRNRRPTATRS